MRILKKLIPQFLINIDKDWQHKYPRLWSTRLHYHVWFILLLNTLAFALGMLLRVELWSFYDPESLFGFLVLPIIFYFAFWVYKVVLFSIEKRFGLSTWAEAVWEFAVLFFSIALILTIPYTLSLTVAWRAGSQISDEQLAQDVNFLNEWSYIMHASNGYHDDQFNAEPLTHASEFEYDNHSIGGYYRSDMHQYFRNLEEYLRRDSARRPNEPNSLNNTYQDLINQYNAEQAKSQEYIDRATLKYYSKELSSIEHTGLYLLTDLTHFSPRSYDQPDWDVFNVDNQRYYDNAHSTQHFFRGRTELQNSYVDKIKRGILPSNNVLLKIIALSAKYQEAPLQLTPAYLLNAHENRRPMRGTPLHIDRSIENVWKAKNYAYDFMKPEFILLFLVNVVFGLTLAVSIFKQVYWQPFLLSLVTTAILPIIILIGVLIVCSQINGLRETDAFTVVYSLLAIFLIASLLGVKNNVRYTTISSIISILGNLLLPFFALLLLVVLEDAFDIFRIDELATMMQGFDHQSTRYIELDRMRDDQKALFNLMLATCWIGGILGYWLIGHPWMRSLHKHIIGLPERK